MFQAKSHFLKCEEFLLVFVIYDRKRRVFVVFDCLQIKKDILKTSLLALGKCNEHISQLDDKSFKNNGRITR